MSRISFLNVNILIASISYFAGGFNYAHAECNNTKNWFQLPGTEVRALIGYKQDFRGRFGEANVTSGEPEDPFSPMLSGQMLDQHSGGKLSKEDNSYISYYEKAGKDAWRICRLETWFPPGLGSETQQLEMLKISAQYVSKNPELAKLTSGHMAVETVLYSYDAVGRIARIEEAEFLKAKQGPRVKLCRLYDSANRLLYLVNPHATQSCSFKVPDVCDE